MPPKAPPSALEKALRLLSVRALSGAELTVRLRRAGFPPEEVAAAVRECAKHRYIDDALLAEDCAGSWQRRGHGARSIRCKLRQRLIPQELADAALAATAEHETETAENAIEAKLPSLLREKDPMKRKAKALRFLAARGFSPEAIRAAMARLRDAVRETEEDTEL